MRGDERVRNDRGASRLAILLPVLAASGLAALSSGASPFKGTVLSGSVRDPVTDAWDAGQATVRIGNRSTRTDAAGEFEIRHRRRRGRALWTAFSADGYQPYYTWTLPGTETNRQPYMFPERTVRVVDDGLVSDGVQTLTAEGLRRHFNTVYRDEYYPPGQPMEEPLRGLRRWMQPPEIVIFNNLVEGRVVDGKIMSVATGRSIGPRVRRRLKRAVRTAIGPLTGGFLTADTLRVRRLADGDPLGSTFAELMPPGELRLFVSEEEPGGSGGAWLDGHTIVGAALWMSATAMRQSESDYGPNAVLHELGHTVGMDHPSNPPGCSVVSLFKCYEYSAESVLPPFDRVIGRLAYSRLPGNDKTDQDPRAASANRGRAGRLTLYLFDGASRLRIGRLPGEERGRDR